MNDTENEPKKKRSSRKKTKLPSAALADPSTSADAIIKAHSLNKLNTLRFWRGSFYRWADGCYRPQSIEDIRALITLTLNKRFSNVGTAIVSNVFEQLRAKSIINSNEMPPCWLNRRFDGWDVRDCVATLDAIIHLPSLARGDRNHMIPATPEMFHLSAIPYRYDPTEIECPNWLAFLEQIFPDDAESKQLLQEWFGLCLVSDVRYQKILLLQGAARSGKGTILRLLQKLIGESNAVPLQMGRLASNFGLEKLVGKSLAIFGDVRDWGGKDEAKVIELLLSISGADGIDIDRKHQSSISCTLNTRLAISSNRLPELKDSSRAFHERLLVLKFDQSFAGREDIHLGTKLESEIQAILNWSIEGWTRLNARGAFVQPKRSKELLDRISAASSPVAKFISDRCDVHSEAVAIKDELYDAFKHWQHQNDLKLKTREQFFKELFEAESTLIAGKISTNSRRIPAIRGIALKAAHHE